MSHADQSFMSRLLALLIALLVATSADARIGETPIQLADRYGRSKDTQLTQIQDKTSPLVEGAVHHTYEYQGWKIRAAFLQLDGPCVRMDYQKILMTGVTPVIQDYELQAIMTANTPAGMSWAPMAYDNPDSPNKGFAKAAEASVAVGQKMWRRSDGAILWSRSNLIVRLELLAAREYESQLKAAKRKKARDSMPHF